MPRTIVTSWSEIDAARQCPHKHDLMFRQGWKPSTTSPALARGDAWHQVMEARYEILKGVPLHRTLRDQEILRARIDDATGAVLARLELEPEEVDLVAWMHEGYTEHYGLDPEWEIVLVEQPFSGWLPTPNGGRSNIKLRGKLDMLVKWKGKLWLVDHKSGKDLLKKEMVELADQFGLYTWLLRQNGYKVFGQLHNGARTQRNKTKPQPLEERFARTPMYRTDAELERIALDAYWTAKRAWDSGDQERHPNVDTCRWRCPYTEACLHGRKTTAEQEIDFLRSAGFAIDLSPRY